MAIYGIARLTTGAASGTAAIEVRTASTDRGKVERMGIHNRLGTTSILGIGRPAAIGVTPTSPVTWLAFNPADPAGTVQTALAWSTGPTVPANFFMRLISVAEGGGYIFTFPRLLVIAVSSSIVLWNLAANDTFDVQVLGEE